MPPHTHTREDEYSIVIEGEIGFRSGDREVVLGSAIQANGLVLAPSGVKPHPLERLARGWLHAGS